MEFIVMTFGVLHRVEYILLLLVIKTCLNIHVANMKSISIL